MKYTTHIGEIDVQRVATIREKIKPYMPPAHEIVLRKNRVDAFVQLAGNTLTIERGAYSPQVRIFRPDADHIPIVIKLTDEQKFQLRYPEDGIYMWNQPALRRLVNSYLGEE